jgi:hypothetical protein
MSQKHNNSQEKIKINYEEDMYNFNQNEKKYKNEVTKNEVIINEVIINEVTKNKNQDLLNNTSITVLYEEYQY